MRFKEFGPGQNMSSESESDSRFSTQKSSKLNRTFQKAKRISGGLLLGGATLLGGLRAEAHPQAEQQKQEKVEQGSEAYQIILKRIEEANTLLPELQKTDFAELNTELAAQTEALKQVLAGIDSANLDELSDIKIPETLPTDPKEAIAQLEKFKEKLDTTGKSLTETTQILRKTSDQASKSKKYIGDRNAVYADYDDVANFMNSPEYQKLADVQKQQTASWRQEFRPKLVDLVNRDKEGLTGMEEYQSTGNNTEIMIQKLVNIDTRIIKLGVEAEVKMIKLIGEQIQK